ncbi:hypothetical protein L208DRAFT_1401510, partial [Tricholoma matsutake]
MSWKKQWPRLRFLFACVMEGYHIVMCYPYIDFFHKLTFHGMWCRSYSTTNSRIHRRI